MDKPLSMIRATVRLRPAIAMLACMLLFAATGRTYGQSTAAPIDITVNSAVAQAIKQSSDVAGAVADWNSARAKALAAELQMLPSVSVSGSYTRLSQLPTSDTNLTLPLPALVGGPVTVSLAGPQDAYSFGVSVRYPVFAGFRLMQAAKIAGLQTTGKELGIQIVRNALTFEVERTYWEAVRASANVTTMLKNKDLVGVLLGQVKDQLDQGLATESDLLSAEESYNQAQIMLNDAISGRNQAFLVLSSFLGQDKVGEELAGSGSGGFSADAVAAYVLSTDPAKSLFPELDGKLDPSKLVAEALANRPEMQTAAVGLETARRAVAASQGALYPTLALIGDYSYANPNQRVLIANGQFTGTWDVGVALSIDVGKLPANAAGAKAAGSDETRAQAQTDAERSKIILDVRKSLLAFEQARQDLAMTQSMVSQADEYLRVTQQKFDNGLAKHSDVLQAELAQLRAHFAVTNKQVDLQIASADLARALGLGAAT